MESYLKHPGSVDNPVIREYIVHLENKEFPCVAAREAAARGQVKCFVAQNLACPNDDKQVLEFLYSFVDEYRSSGDLYCSAAVIFTSSVPYDEALFDSLLWKRLQCIADLDAMHYGYDTRVSSDPSSAKFSFSIKGEAFYVIGLHANSSRPSRQFKYPVLVFNPHAQFEQLRKMARYEKMKDIVRKRDVIYSGSINPMLRDFGEFSEAYQYSGRKYDKEWICPLKINHGATKHNSTS